MASVINSAGVLLMLPPLFLSPVRLSINSEGKERDGGPERQGHVDDGGGGVHGV